MLTNLPTQVCSFLGPISKDVKKIILVVVSLCRGGGCPIGVVSLIVHFCSNNLGCEIMKQQNSVKQPPYSFRRLETCCRLCFGNHLYCFTRTMLVRNLLIMAFHFGRSCSHFCFPFWEKAYCIPKVRGGFFGVFVWFFSSKAKKPRTP